MKSISSLQTALKLIIRETPDIQEALLILGSSPVRPLHVYQMCFSGANAVPQSEFDFSKNKAAEGLSRKAQSSLNLPLHFLPKHDFRCNKKIMPLRLQFKCRSKVVEMVNDNHASQTGQSVGFEDSAPRELMWFQCRHVIKGVAVKSSEEEWKGLCSFNHGETVGFCSLLLHDLHDHP